MDYSKLITAGLHIFPTEEDKSPLEIDYGHYRAAIKWMDTVDMSLFEKPHYGVGMGLGRKFGNYGCVDIDNKIGNTDRILEVIASRIGSLFDSLTIDTTTSGGYHLIYRCEHLEGSRKLTYMADFMDGNYKCTIETKEHNSYIVIPPSPRYKTIQGDLTNVEWITPKERQLIMDVCLGLNERPAQVRHRPHGGKCSDAAGEYARELLESKGWTFFGHKYVRRPGKQRGTSATFGYHTPYTLYIFSTDSDIMPFQEKVWYGPLDIVALLDFNGDMEEAKRFFRLKKWRY